MVWLAYTLSFVLLWLLPSNPIEIMLTGSSSGVASSSPEVIAQLEQRYGFDKNVVAQYLDMLGRTLTGDLGDSISTGRPVAGLLAENILPTLTLGLASLALGAALGVLIAIAANAAGWSWLRNLLFAVPPFIGSVPTFWAGLILIQIFAFGLNVLPAAGGQGLAGLVLPTLTLGVAISAGIAQVAARGLEENLGSAYADFLRARGVPQWQILIRHTLRNALIPVATLLGVYVGAIFAGAVITETVFSRPGLGRVLQSAVAKQDIPVVQGVVIICAVSFALFNLLVDLLYPLIDPRITARKEATS